MKNEQVCNVMLADDHVLLRDALAALIDSFDECNIIGVASSGKDLVRLFAAGKLPDIVVLDLNMPDMDGYETAEKIRDNPKLIVVDNWKQLKVPSEVERIRKKISLL